MGEIEDLLKRIFKVLETPEEIMREIGLRKHGLGLGELSVLAVATFLIQQETQSSVITIIDDKRGRRAAEELGLKRHGTLWMIIQLKKHGIINKEEAIKIVGKLPYQGFHLNGETLKQAIREIRSDC